MLLLRSLRFYQSRATYRVAGLSSSVRSPAVTVTLKFGSSTGTRRPFKLFELSVISRCVPSVISRYVGQGHVCLSTENVGHSSSAVDTVKSAGDAKAGDLLVKHVVMTDVDAEKTGTHVHVDESKRELVVYVDNAFVTTKAIDLYHMIRNMDTEQVRQFLLVSANHMDSFDR